MSDRKYILPSNKMFSSLSSYIWGEGEEAAAPEAGPRPQVTTRDPSPDDWVLVGESSSPAPGNLGGCLPPLPGDSVSSSATSSACSEAGDSAEVAEPAPVVAASRQRQPASLSQQAAKRELRREKSAQLVKQKNSGKALTSKALNRTNKTVYSSANKKQQFRQNLNLKMAGANKNLKQC